MIWRFYVLTSYFYLLYYYFSPSASPFTFYLYRVFNVHNWAFDFIRFFDPLFFLCVSLSLIFKLDLGLAVFFYFFFFSTKSPEMMGKRKLCIPSNKHGRGVFQQVFAS